MESIHAIDVVTNILSTACEKRFVRISTRNIEHRFCISEKICIAKRPHYGDAHLLLYGIITFADRFGMELENMKSR